MLNNHKQFVAWRRQVFVRNPHRDLNALYAGLAGRSGIYLIGCADEIVYVGQSWDLTERPIDSLGRVDKRGSPGAVIVIQAGICNGDQRGTRPDVERRVGVL